MGWEIPPGHVPMVIVTPEQYLRFMGQRGPNLWPVYFGARMAAHTIQDVLMKLIQRSRVYDLKGALPLMIEAGLDVAREQAYAGPTGDIRALKDDIKRLRGGLYDNWAAGIMQGMGAAYSSAMDSFINSGQLVYAAKTLAYHTAITPRMRRHWNEEFTPMVPGGGMAWVLYRRGSFTESQYFRHMAWDGWARDQAELVQAAMEHLPNPREAFYLWAKGLIPEETRNRLYFAGGFNSEWHSIMTDNYYYTPTIYDLTRMADYIELDQIWALDMMKKRGVRDRDRAKIWEMLELRPVRDEVRSLTFKWAWRYKFGRCSMDKLSDELLDLKIRPKEKELLLKKAQMDYEDELIDEWIEILRWRFRTALISEDEFMKGLIDLGIRDEKANLIVELEKAKGYYGYY